MKYVVLAMIVGWIVGCGDIAVQGPEPEMGPSDPSQDPIWKDVRYPGCPETVDPADCERVISFAWVDYMVPGESDEWVAVPGQYRLEYEIWRDGGSLLDGSLPVSGSLRGTGHWSGWFFSLVLVPDAGSQLPEAGCEFRVSEDDVIRDASEPEPGVIFCVNEEGTAAARFEYDRCSTWGPLPEQNTCPTLEDDIPEIPEIPEVDLSECEAGVCSCTDAGIRAAAAHEEGTFVFACDGPTTVATVAEIVFEGDAVLDGEGRLTVDGGGTHLVFHVSRGANATLRRMRVTGGSGARSGGSGGISSLGDLVLEEVEVSENIGSGIIGGDVAGATLEILNSAVERNSDVGVLAYDGTSTTIAGSMIRDNGGTGVISQGVVSIADSVLSGNHTGLTVGREATVVRTTLSHNAATRSVGGGIVMCNGDLRLENSTVSGNSASREGGGILVYCARNSVTIINSTVADNVAATGANGISSLLYAELTVRNSIIAGTCEGEVTSGGGNVESPGNTCSLDAESDQVNVDAGELGLLALGSHGGPTPTHALAVGSVAVDAVPADECLGVDDEQLATDQRGFGRDPMCDAGSFELR